MKPTLTKKQYYKKEGEITAEGEVTEEPKARMTARRPISTVQAAKIKENKETNGPPKPSLAVQKEDDNDKLNIKQLRKEIFGAPEPRSKYKRRRKYPRYIEGQTTENLVCKGYLHTVKNGKAILKNLIWEFF
ncbi:hypothetical protein MMC15_005608 [Xylographa vitiligo]|nr:hypothetical protein [Xylographa vitiligo]